MILYHGSIRQFDVFQISEELTRGNVGDLAEGLGVYMTEDGKFAASYGSYIYKVEVDSEKVIDLTNRKIVNQLINGLDKASEGLISKYLSKGRLKEIVDSIVTGKVSATKFGTEIDLYIDENEAYHLSGDAEKEISIQKLYEPIVQAHVIRYHDPQFTIPVVYIAKNAGLLKIV